MVLMSESLKMVQVYTILTIVLLAIVLNSCSPQTNSQTNAQLAAIQTQLKQLNAQLAKIEQDKSSGEWILWLTRQDPRNLWNGIYTNAQSAFPTKESCLKAAYGWSLPGGKIIGMDPYIVQTSTEMLTYRCLPKGVKPL